MKSQGRGVVKNVKDPIIKELDAIKKLLILWLMKNGVKQGEIARAMGMDQGDLSRLMPAKEFRTNP